MLVLERKLGLELSGRTEHLPVQEQIGQDGSTAEQQGTGIILRRKKREDSSPSKVGDPLVIADMVQRLCQVTLLLKKGMAVCTAMVVIWSAGFAWLG